MERLICLAIGYGCGLFQTSYIYGRMNKIDIRSHGSGNAGTTNALRTLGWKAGVITFLGDCLKCVVAVLIVRYIFGESQSESLALLSMYAGAGTVLGHNFPFYMKLRGGKGIAATAGLILSTNLYMTLAAAVTFFVLVGVTRYVSLGSLVMVTLFLIEVIVYGQQGGFGMEQAQLYELYIVVGLLTVLAFYRHRANIGRLLHGTENKLEFKK